MESVSRTCDRSTSLIWTLFVAHLLVVALPAIAAEIGPQPGDLVQIRVYGQPDLTTVSRVAQDGSISFPFIGRVRVGGVPTEQAEANIARGLENQGIVLNPQVNLLIQEQSLEAGEHVTIVGAVEQPGRYSLGEGTSQDAGTLVELLAMAGGATDSAANRVTLFRSVAGDEQRIEVDIQGLVDGSTLAQGSLQLLDGDVVVVPQTDVFYIHGQVEKPGRYPLQSGMMVMQAISVSGGITERGSERNISITRREGNDIQAREVRLDETLLPGDVIYVKESLF